MKKSKRILTTLAAAVLFLSGLCIPVFALTEAEVQAKVAVAGNGDRQRGRGLCQ